MNPIPNRSRQFRSVHILVSLLLLTGLVACSGGGGEGSGEPDASPPGAVTFSTALSLDSASRALRASRSLGPISTVPIDCEADGVARVEGIIYDAAGNEIARGGPWECSLRSGIIENVPPGSGLHVEISALDPEGGIKFKGKSDPFEVRSNETTNGGLVALAVRSDRPITAADMAETDQGAAVTISVLDNDTSSYFNDVLGAYATIDPATVSIAVSPETGSTEILADGTIRYTPGDEAHGSDRFHYQVSDDLGIASAETLVTVTITRNAPPVAREIPASDPVTTAEDTAVVITLAATDAEADPLTFSVVAQPSHGALSGTPPDLTYTPEANYYGTDTFTFVASDPYSDSSPAGVAIAVQPVNDPPVAADNRPATAPLETPEDTAVAVQLEATDIDGDTLTFFIVEPPAHGTLDGTGSAYSYQPAPDFTGPDQFSFKASDGSLDSNTVVVHLSVLGQNDPPVAIAPDNSPVTTDEDTSVAITLAGSDPDGDPLTFTLLEEPAHGIIEGNPPSLVYVPDTDFHGSDALTFTVSDGIAESAPLSVPITVTSVNDPPAVEDGVAYLSIFSAEVSLTPTFTDPDTGDTHSVSILDETGLEGFLSVTNDKSAFLFTPAYDFVGFTRFTFTLSDDKGGSAEAAFDLKIAPVVTRVNVNADGGADPYTEANAASTAPVISETGRHAAFASLAANLVAGDGNGVQDIFAHDLSRKSAPVTALISVSSNQSPANGSSDQPAISGDGRFVAFASAASNLASGDTNAVQDIFLRDRDPFQSGTFDSADAFTQLVSVDSSGNPGNEASTAPDLSADGRYIAFASTADNLIAGGRDANPYSDIFIHDRINRTTVTVSANNPNQTFGPYNNPALSGTGRYVVFEVDDIEYQFQYLILHDRDYDGNGIFDESGTDLPATLSTPVAFRAADGDTLANGDAAHPDISASGRYVVFESVAENLVTHDGNGYRDIYLYDTQTGITALISQTMDGVSANGNSHHPAISADGRYISFESTASNLVADDTNGSSDLFIVDREMLLGNATDSLVGKWILRASVDRYEQEASALSTPSAPQSGISGDGRFAVFTSAAANLLTDAGEWDAPDLNGLPDIFVTANRHFMTVDMQ